MAWSATLAATLAVGLGVAMARAERERRAGGDRIPERERRFGLLTSEAASDGLRRIALAQLDLAIELLRGEAGVPGEVAVHETRKAFKRVRALLALLEDELGSARAKHERDVLRDAAKRLAGARDAEVMVQAYDALIARERRRLGAKRGAVELRERLLRERQAAAERTLSDTAAREQVAVELLALRERVQTWSLRERSAHRLTRRGLERIYRSGRVARRRARADERDSLALHRWRKHAKELRYALEILDVQDPHDRPKLRALRRRDRRSAPASGRIAKLAKRADALGELLGDEHDLMLLDELVRAHEPLQRRRRTRKRLLRAIARRRGLLRKRAMREGARLYERKPARFVRGVRASLRA